MSYGNWKHILGVFKLWKQSYDGILVIKHSYMGPISLVKSDSLLFPTDHSHFSFILFFYFFPFFSTFLSFSLLLFLFFFRAKSHPHRKTKESQPSPSTTFLLRSACRSLFFIVPTPTNPTNNSQMGLSLRPINLQNQETNFSIPIP